MDDIVMKEQQLDRRYNVAVLFLLFAGVFAALAWTEGTRGFASEFAQQHHEHLMLAFPTLAAISGIIGGFLIGSLKSKPRTGDGVNRKPGN
ncbi:hypothetical protein L4Z64_001464 [Pseudomonas aeruginosa]|nr:hypothetical protein [Pseudomonas aeruginosa]MBX6653678.1 hypothetical protein [Pseudomonas aeruginosa]